MIRQLLLAAVSAVVLSGCAGWPDGSDIRSLIEKSGASAPKLSAYEQGKQHLQLQDFGLAIELFQRELAKNANSVPALNGLAVAFDRLGRKDIARSYLERALGVDPNSVVTLTNLAYLNVTIGERLAAIAYSDRAEQATAHGQGEIPDVVQNAVSRNAAAAAVLGGVHEPTAGTMEPPNLPAPADVLEHVGDNEWHFRTPDVTVKSLDAPEASVQEQGSPARASQQWTGSIPTGTVLRVSNGTGRPSMAKRFAGYLSRHGLTVHTLTNEPSYDNQESTIFYNPDQLSTAENFARNLPLRMKLVEAKQGAGEIEIIVGSDWLVYDDELRLDADAALLAYGGR